MKRTTLLWLCLGACGAPTRAPASAHLVEVADAGGTPTSHEVQDGEGGAAPFEADPRKTYVVNAEEHYAYAERLVMLGRLGRAREEFAAVVRLYWYARVRPIAERRIADMDFAQGRFAAAAEAYEAWARDHRSRVEEADAARKRAETARCRAAGKAPCADAYDAGL
jgi:hypothetical protein